MQSFHSELAEQFRRLTSRRFLFVAWIVASTAALLHTAALTIFMIDPARTELASFPQVPAMARHSCLTAYVMGSELAREGAADLYSPEHYDAETTTVELDTGSFILEPFQYPPQFLLPLDLLTTLVDDFVLLRAVWYFLIVFLSAGTIYGVSRWIGGEPGARLLLWSPLLWVSPLFVGTLQSGNVHFVIVALAFLAMIAFDRGRHATGGLLLAYAISSKVFPGIFGIYLLVQRRWREAAWTAGFGVVLAAGSALAHGPDLMVQFLRDQLPRLADGSAFDAFRAEEWYPFTSVAFRSVALKMDAAGLIDGWEGLVGPLGLLYTLTILPLSILLALRIPQRNGDPGQRMTRFLTWSLVLTLASFQGPFTPLPYAPLGSIWLVVATGVAFGGGKKLLFALASLWVLLSFPVLVPTYSLVTHVSLYAFLFTLAAVLLRSRSGHRPSRSAP